MPPMTLASSGPDDDGEPHHLPAQKRLQALDDVAAAQGGALSRTQLRALGVHREEVRRRVAHRRWVVRTPNVVSLTTGPASPQQRLWIAVLHAVPPVALAGRTALQLHGLTGWESDTVEAIVATGEHHGAAGVRYHRSRRPFVDWTTTSSGLPVLDAEHAAVLAASRTRHPRSAAGLLAACVQQQLATATALARVAEALPSLAGRRRILATLGELEGGAQSVAEIDLGAICRRAGLAPPHRQVERRDAAGRRRWTDAEWLLPSGDVLVLEVDGGFHAEVRHWIADKRRHRRLVAPGRIVVGCTAIELRTTPDAVIADLVALGVPRLRRAA